MSVRKMHPNQVDIDVELVRRLVADQFPQWAKLPLRPYASTGTVNAIYRLGDDMYVRLPLVETWARGLEAEATWLPYMRPHLPVEIPELIARGEPAEDYPFGWSVYGWIEGETWQSAGVRDNCEAAVDLAGFLRALQSVDSSGVEPLDTQFDVPLLAAQDEWIRQSIHRARDMIDADTVTAAWDSALQLPPFDGPYVWVHSDIGPNNLLVRQGRLSAVIDWSAVHVGDAAIDIIAAWGLLSGDGRKLFREELSFDEATWARACAWGLRAVGGLDYYRDTNPAHVRDCLAGLNAVLDQFAAS